MRRRLILLLVLVTPFASSWAATRNWTGSSSELWSVAANWDGAVPAAGDDLVFPAAAAIRSTINDLPAGTLFHSITISGPDYTMTGHEIQLGDGGMNAGSSETGSVTVAFPITLAADQVWLPNSTTAPFHFMGALHLAGHRLTLRGEYGSLDGPITGPPSRLLVESGTWDLTGNPFPADFGVDATGSLSDVLALQAPGGIVVHEGATVSTNPQVAIGTADARDGRLAVYRGGTTGDVLLGPSPSALFYGFSDLLHPFGRLFVHGTVSLGGADLTWQAFGFNEPPFFTNELATGSYVIVDNDSTDAVIGTFTNFPEGVALPKVGGKIDPEADAQQFRVTYHGGDGNDVVLDALAISRATLASDPNPAPPGYPVTFVVKVTSRVAGPTGTVQLLEKLGNDTTATEIPNATGTLDANGSATIVVQLPPGTHRIYARYDGDALHSNSALSYPVVQQIAGAAQAPAQVPALDPWALALLAAGLAAAALLALHR